MQWWEGQQAGGEQINDDIARILVYAEVLGCWDSAVVATGYGLDGPGCECRWGEIFRAMQTGPGTHPAKMEAGIFSGVERSKKLEARIVFNNVFFLSKIVAFMWKNIAERGRPQMTICHMHVACWIPKATNTHVVCHIHCFSSAIMVARPCLKVPLHVHGLCCTLSALSFNHLTSPSAVCS